jgi:spore maturation protein CgeB
VWTLLPGRHRLRKYLRGGVTDNDKAATLYRQAKVGLNLHRTSREFARGASHIQHAESMNPRAYELAACGVFQISDCRSEVREIFDWTVPTFDTPEQLEGLIRLSLERSAERQQKALQARQRVLPHTFAARAAQVLADLERVSQQPIAKGA